MSYYDENSSYNRNVANRRQIGDKFADQYDAEKRRDERLSKQEERYRTFGNHAATPVAMNRGKDDRENAQNYNDSDWNEQVDKNSYNRGFYEFGNRYIAANIDKMSEEKIIAIAQNDAQNGVDFKTLPEVIKNNTTYASYYMATILASGKNK